MKYNSLFINLYVAGLYETFCIINVDRDCILFDDFTFIKNNQPQKRFILIMENLQ